MSFLDTLKGFGGWMAKEWAKIYKTAPKIEQIADAVLSYSVPALQIVLGMVAPEELPIVLPIVAEIQKDLHVASGLIYDFGAQPETASIVNSIEQNLNDLLTAGHIKDAALIAKVQGVTKTVGTLATALSGAVSK